MREFIQDANIERFTALLATTDDENERRLLQTLLAEEKLKARPGRADEGEC
jgi:hypothetical protein